MTSVGRAAISRLRITAALRGDLSAAGITFAFQAVIKLCSSLILTRLLTPNAYGIIGMLMSVAFVLVLISDIGFAACIVRSPRGEEASYLNTAWTIRFFRAILNASVMYFGAPLIAALYHAPSLTGPLRVISLWFLIDGVESTAYPVAIRRKNSRIVMYSETLGAFVGAIFTVAYCYFSRDFWGMVYGTLVNRMVVVVMSHRFYRELRPRFQWDRSAAKEIFSFTRFVAPSSALTVFLGNFDRAVFLRFFDFNLLGIYSLGGNIASPVESLIGKVTQMVLFPRCAHNFRESRDTFSVKYYLENVRLYLAILGIPAAIAGSAHLLVTALYDPRYARAAAVLQAFMLRAVLSALGWSAENMLIATGESRLTLVGNVYRVIWMAGASLLGYRLYGFIGFTYGVASSGLPSLAYYLWLQARKGLLIPKYEAYKVAFACAVAACSYLASELVLALLPGIRIML